MAVDRTTLRTTAAIERRPAVSTRAQRSVAETPRSPARALQERLGNRGTQALIARSMAPDVAVNVTVPPSVQLSKTTRLPSKVSKPHDPGELEAEETARKVMRMRDPPATAPAGQKGIAKGTVQRAEAAPSPAPAASSPRVHIAGGSPLPSSVRSHMEPRFGASFGHVRVHTGEAAAQQSAGLNAHAFTVGGNIFFAKDKFQPQSSSGRELIAHELTHTIQQSASVQRKAEVAVTQRSEPRVQRFGISDALDWIADKARYIPGFTLLTFVLGMNPINWKPVERSGANLLRALLELIPVVGPLLAQALDNHGIFAKVGAWMEGKVRTLGLIGSAIRSGLDKFLDSLSWRDIFDLDDVYERGKRIFTDPINRLLELGKSVVVDILGFIREAVLIPLAKLAEGTRGYDLLKALLGEDPITRQPVPRTPETLIGGFMKLIGQEEVWENIKKANAIPRAWAWFQGAVEGLKAIALALPTNFVNALKSLEVIDLVLIPRAFAKVGAVFGHFILDFLSWAGNAVWDLLQIILDVVAPGAVVYLKKAGAALKTILKNPIPFVINLANAAKLGFEQFSANFAQHLMDSLLDWLTGSLPGVYIPKALSLMEFAKMVFSVLGLSWATIRLKLVKLIGEPTVKAMEKVEDGLDIVVALVRDGPMAAWDKLKESLADLQEKVISGIIDTVIQTVITKATLQLAALFVPGLNFIVALVKIYDIIMVFVRKLSKLVAVVKAFVDSIMAIASGAIDVAASRVEGALAGLLTLAINLLAAFAGVGNIADKVMGVINKIRVRVDQALDKLVAWIANLAKKAWAGAKAGVKAIIGWWKAKVGFKAGGEDHSLFFQGEGTGATLMVASEKEPVKEFLKAKKNKAKGDKDKLKAIDTVNDLLEEVASLTTGKAKKKLEGEALQKEIERLMNLIGKELVVLLVSTDWGTKENPAPFDYPKRRAEAYPTFYLAIGTLAGKSQETLQDRFAKQKSGKNVEVFELRPTGSTKLPGESETLGLGEASQVQVGTKVLFEGKEKRGSGVDKFKSLLARFGFVAKDKSWDIDHVVELQIGGKDEFPNLWPLPLGENRSSGSIIKDATIEIPATKEQKPVKTALAEKKTGLWLLIKSTWQR